tara:strand:+ start:1141 stop:1779 length:639 start_codon:yes stop_codon:yes gene_type:complete
MDRSKQLDTFNRFTQVSRETIESLIKYEDILIKSNKDMNLIGKSTIDNLWIRHFLDSAQVIDFIDKNDKSLVDIGSGAGFPGLVIALMSLDRKISLNVKLLEKSPKKTKFLKKLINDLGLNVEVINKNIFTDNILFSSDVLVARAFKPLEVTLELIHNKAKNWKKIFIYQGKSGKKELLQASKIWDIGYKQRVSATSDDSVILEINKLEKLN